MMINDSRAFLFFFYSIDISWTTMTSTVQEERYSLITWEEKNWRNKCLVTIIFPWTCATNQNDRKVIDLVTQMPISFLQLKTDLFTRKSFRSLVYVHVSQVQSHIEYRRKRKRRNRAPSYNFVWMTSSLILFAWYLISYLLHTTRMSPLVQFFCSASISIRINYTFSLDVLVTFRSHNWSFFCSMEQCIYSQ